MIAMLTSTGCLEELVRYLERNPGAYGDSGDAACDARTMPGRQERIGALYVGSLAFRSGVGSRADH
jgi:hypothetical protein